MRIPEFSAFEQLLLKNDNSAGTAALLFLGWIASCDGHVDAREREQLVSIAKESGHNHSVSEIFAVVEGADLAAIQLASELVRVFFSGERSRLFMQMAIGMAIADGYLTISENYVLRFMADLVGIDDAGLDEIFVEMTGKQMISPSDPSSVDWWNARASSRSGERQSGANSTHGATPQTDDVMIRRLKALAMLGLDEDASPQEIRAAYRRMAKIHHPDRFVSVGQEAVAAATVTFRRIKDAYDYLIADA